ncbi:hypothetical protein K450DRAFT_237277 [Umbelopsis ramanniana AG]|uniref:Uncharacterized protein n=1 Tax=Umbelopsis ramanniana AG TaxID=1314678 RepID=A0AAD5EC44_UMBRA|nr:uncharacterized protein K450DRAFT_237277 [Umbelopsis ramanniana AG]KAI8580489.1 hypothetical protein K450DRAFT_237277 [Umbelopsis ramanniana AG]
MSQQWQAFVRQWNEPCCLDYQKLNEKENHMLKEHLVSILETQVRPSFQKHTHPALDKRLQNGRYVDKSMDFDFHENQTWKQIEVSGFSAIDVIEWIIERASAEQLQPVYHMVAPPILIVLDDYESNYKLRGVQLIQAVLRKVEPVTLRRSGLGNVFLESLFQCLTYVHGESANPRLVEASYSCCRDLINLLESETSKERSRLYEKLVVEGLLLSQSSEMLDIQLINMKEVPPIFSELGIISVQYLKPILQLICENLQRPYSNMDLKIASASALLVMLQSCTPRIPAYRGQIIIGLLNSWIMVQNDQNDDSQDLRKLLTENWQLLRKIGGSKVEVRA